MSTMFARARGFLTRARHNWRTWHKRSDSALQRGAHHAGVATLVFFIAALAPAIALAKKGAAASTTVGGVDLLGNDSVSNRPLILMTAMAGLALIPFVGLMVTSFVKIAVVLSITTAGSTPARASWSARGSTAR